ncbi:MAG: type IV toxin-antitoxin system AbiEi family antitoxin domain-containing protein [Actinobacteria bacterium]|nr:type IV toxin-antitoxin system AbiEi family antitoxin domain-containing protein [Actinomycetota bacterium]
MVDDEHRSALERLGYEARKRGGCFTRQQAYAEGVIPARFHHLTSTGVIVPVHPGRAIFRFAGTPTTWESDLHAALLIASPAAVVSHRSAARLWGLEDFGVTTAIDLSLRARKSRRHVDGVTVHLTRWLPEAQVVKVGAVDRVTVAARTIRDLARYLPHDRLLPVAVDACRRKLTDPEELARCHLEMGRAWGARTMESVLEILDDDCLRAASVPELDLHVALIGDDRVPSARPQLPGDVAEGSTGRLRRRVARSARRDRGGQRALPRHRPRPTA